MTTVTRCNSRVTAKPHLKMIRHDGNLIGYRVYRSDGFLGARRFAGYHYLSAPVGGAPAMMEGAL